MVAHEEKKVIESVGYVFCNDEFLLALNKKFLSHKTLTDIITFDYSQKNKIVAEIYISIDRVKENAFLFKNSISEELNRVMIHGVLHCMGYGDKNEKDKKKMRSKEDYYLKLLNDLSKN